MLDAGALVAVERGDRRVAALVKHERLAQRAPRTHGGVVGQVWRDGSRQAPLARLLAGSEVSPLDTVLGRQAGVLLGHARTSDVVDGALVVLAHDGDTVLTSDVGDLAHLAAVADVHLDVVPV